MPTLRSAVRGVLRSKGLSLAATMCIGLGAAATMSVATLANAVLLREPPFPDADRLVRVWLDEQGVDPRLMFSIPESREVRALPAFDAAIGTARVRAVAITSDGAERLRGEAVDEGYFELLDVRPAAGRLLDARDHRDGGHGGNDAPVIVLGYGLWQRAYGGSESAIGTTFRTERAAYTIVGVAPRSFTGSVEDDMVEFWTPMQHHEPRAALLDRDVRQTWILARLAPGVPRATAGAQAAALARDWLARDPQRYRGRTLRVEPFGESWRGGFRQGTSVLLGAAGVLLAVAALNVGCLLLARVLDRRREFAVRTALGASRAIIVRQLVVEAVVMCAAGGVLGLLAGPWLLRLFLAAAPVALPAYLSVTPDLRVAAASFGALVVAALAAGTAPALVGGDLGLSKGMQLDSRGAAVAPGERRWVTLLIASESALTLMLLVSGGLLLRSYDNLASLDLGYRREGIARLAVTLSRADAGPIASRNAVFERVRDAVASVPGVESVGLVSPTLPPWDPDRARVRYDGMDARFEADGLPVGLHQIDEGLLGTLNIAVIAGRSFTRIEPGRVAIVSRGLADRLGGPQASLERTIIFPSTPGAALSASALSGPFRIVGVAENVAYDGLREQDTQRVIRYGDGTDPRAGRWDVYVPLSLAPPARVSIGVFTRGDAASLIDPIRRGIARVAPTSAVHWTGTMEEDVAVEYASTRFYGVLVAAFSSSAMLLTGAGLFALLWNASIRRTGEMGLRFALGASRRSVAMLLMAACVSPVAYGASVGLVAALWISDAVKALLYDVPALDPVSFSIAAALLAAVCLLAALVPAARAARVDPAIALRGE